MKTSFPLQTKKKINFSLPAKTKKILLLNPPGKRKYFRDYYCTKVSKGRYYYHPVDLVYLSGRLDSFWRVYLIDAIAEDLGADQCLKKIKKIQPEIILSLVSSPSYFEDLEFLTVARNALPETIIIGTGDVYRELKKEAFEEQNFLDAILLDFSTDDLVKFLKREEDRKFDNIIYKTNNVIIEGEEIHGSGEFDAPVPRWDLFKLEKYSFPFARRKGFASILTDFGCPFKCDFCPVSSLGYKLRPINIVIEEMKVLKDLGVKELFIRDQTFGVNKERTKKLCEAMVARGLNFSWTCFSRVDVINEELLRAMKRAGCHTIIFGIETASEKLLKDYNKNINLEKIKETIALTKRNKIRASGTFILGLPGDSKEAIKKTVDLAIDLDLDFASFNIAVPRFGTKFRADAISNDLVSKLERVMESSDSKPIWINQDISNEEIYQLKNLAVRKFYLRPRYILKRILGLKTWEEFKNSLWEAVELIF